ncbi:hypothetical protein PR048_028278 [Dryococelus australis]|uniref:PiggyBac transposable element-derived protein domain-containing protein n=1 Tax=Dryococelus australis TaxID=614101 RepID=A0ABQ9GIT8_9NEOP|nr:hypothetical protein PR048_028278 [Dryococelus australis]
MASCIWIKTTFDHQSTKIYQNMLDEIPQSITTRKAPLYDTVVIKNNETTLTMYQGKNNKNLLVLSTLHSNIYIGNVQKHLPETVYGVDVPEQMAIKYSVKAAYRSWQVQVFYNILDIVGINAWILFKQITGKQISWRVFLQKRSA